MIYSDSWNVLIQPTERGKILLLLVKKSISQSEEKHSNVVISTGKEKTASVGWGVQIQYR